MAAVAGPQTPLGTRQKNIMMTSETFPMLGDPSRNDQRYRSTRGRRRCERSLRPTLKSSASPHRASFVEIRIEDAHLRDLVERQGVAVGGLADRFWTRRVIDAEGLPLVVTDIGVDPGDAFVGVAIDHGQTARCPLRIDWNVESFRKGPLHDVSRHMRSSLYCSRWREDLQRD